MRRWVIRTPVLTCFGGRRSLVRDRFLSIMYFVRWGVCVEFTEYFGRLPALSRMRWSLRDCRVRWRLAIVLCTRRACDRWILFRNAARCAIVDL